MATPARRLAVRPPRTLAFRTAHQQAVTHGEARILQLARSLNDLVEMGFIEKFKDEHNITRYRPLLVAKRRVA